MQIIDGKKLAAEIREEIAREVEELKASRDITPGLAVVLVGDDPASHAYVKMKAKACKEAGIYSITHEMPESISQSEIEETILMMNKNPNIDGILVQLPLPKHLDASQLLERIRPDKDVDGFHPYNVGRLAQLQQEAGRTGVSSPRGMTSGGGRPYTTELDTTSTRASGAYARTAARRFNPPTTFTDRARPGSRSASGTKAMPARW